MSTSGPMSSSSTPKSDERPVIAIGESPLTLPEFLALASGAARPIIDPGAECRWRIERSAAVLEAVIATDARVYGVTTGVGESVLNSLSQEAADSLPLNLLRFHGCGVGEILGETESAAVLVARLASLARGYGGVRIEVLERLCTLLDRRILPRIPSQGSVGASGDLTPLSYVAAVLVGEREVSYGGQVMPATQALEAEELQPLRLLPKESLALMNGTSVMTALGALAWSRAQRLGRFVAALTAGASDVMGGNPGHFAERIFALKPYPGLVTAGRWIREDVEQERRIDFRPERLQDRYSIRCAPHVIGVLLDSAAAARAILEVEINSINDNPIIDPYSETILHGGNFYGGHVGYALDGLKTAVANIADLVDRQLVLLCDPAVNGGLPANLVGAPESERTAHHGFKAVSIAASALTAEALKLTMPASAFSRSTESHNQDKVPMATIAARDCLKILEMTETIASMAALAVCQAVDLRQGEGCQARALALRESIRRHVPMVTADRRMDLDIAVVSALAAAHELPIGDVDA